MYIVVMLLPVVVSCVYFVWRLRTDVEKERSFRAKLSGIDLEAASQESFSTKGLHPKTLANIPLS